MIAKFILSSLVALLMSVGLINQDAANYMADADRPSSEQVVKAIMIDGDVVPHISLPVVEITADLTADNLVTAEIVDGNVVPMIHLEEVIITPNSGLNSI
jgi:hypothetical protein